MMRLFWLVLEQTVRVAFRKGGGAFGTLAFYVIVVTLFTFGLGPADVNKHISAILCVALLMSNITALPLLYERDYEDGTLEQFILQPVLLELLIMAKICGQWIASVVPLLLISPLLAMMANVSSEQAVDVLITLLLASPTIVALGSIAAALTLGNKRGGLLQAMVVMPLYIPVLIFAASPANQSAYLLLAAMMFASVPLSCIITTILIRIAND